MMILLPGCLRRPILICSAAILISLLLLMPVPEGRAAAEGIVVTQDGRISVDVIDARIDAVLAELSKKAPLHVKGRPGGGETLTLHFSGLTVEEALHKIMAGYNYVLFFPPEGRRGTATLTIVSKAVYGATPPSVPAPPPTDQQAAPGPSRSGGRTPPASPSVPEQATALSPPGQARAPAAQAAPPPSVVPAPPVPDQPAAQPAVIDQPPAQQQAAGQTAQPGAQAATSQPGVLPAPDSQPEFNPAAWGGKGRRR
jgi:hypothetical protein